MKSWQSILIHACVTAVVVFTAIGLFSPDAPPDKTKALQEALSRQIDGIQAKLDVIEKAISEQKKQASFTTAPRESGDASEALSGINRKLDKISGKLSVLENKSTSAQATQTIQRSFGGPMMPPPPAAKGQAPSNWINRLPDEKKREVELILQENKMRLRDKLPPLDPGGKMPDREIIMEIMQENNRILQQELKAVLTEEEYQRFQDSRPQPVLQPPGFPGDQGNP